MFQLKSSVAQSRQKTYLFECLELEELAALIETYSPSHATWVTTGHRTAVVGWRQDKVLFELINNLYSMVYINKM